jgi:hypothetical protein
LSAAVQLSVPPPEFETFTVWAAGLDAPAVPANDRLVGDTASTGVAGFTVSVTGIVLGDPEAPVAVTVIEAV